ncbi:MAG: methyltransferase domain-containing protein [bacterium]
MDKQMQKNLLELVKRNYEEIAEDFDATRKKQLWPELIKLAGMVKDGDKILDVGCGNGRLAEAFREKKINYIGVDNSEKLIESAKKNAIREIASLPAVARNDRRFEVADILELDKLPENNFDYVFSIAVLHHLPGEDLRIKALEQMKNKINNNGKIIITVWNLWSQKKFSRLIVKFGLLKLVGKNPPGGEAGKLDFGDILFNWKNSQGQPASQRYYHAFSRAELGKTVKSAGLRLAKSYHDKYNYYLILTK